MNRNRRRLDVVRDMLSVMLVRVRKTRVMYQANLNYSMLERYLKDLLESGLVKCDGDSYYLITRKGKLFLQKYNDYLERYRQTREKIDETERHRLMLESLCFNGKSIGKLAAIKEVSVEN
jgi:predicted transcriptional regulator